MFHDPPIGEQTFREATNSRRLALQWADLTIAEGEKLRADLAPLLKLKPDKVTDDEVSRTAALVAAIEQADAEASRYVRDARQAQARLDALRAEAARRRAQARAIGSPVAAGKVRTESPAG